MWNGPPVGSARSTRDGPPLDAHQTPKPRAAHALEHRTTKAESASDFRPSATSTPTSGVKATTPTRVAGRRVTFSALVRSVARRTQLGYAGRGVADVPTPTGLLARPLRSTRYACHFPTRSNPTSTGYSGACSSPLGGGLDAAARSSGCFLWAPSPSRSGGKPRIRSPAGVRALRLIFAHLRNVRRTDLRVTKSRGQSR